MMPSNPTLSTVDLMKPWRNVLVHVDGTSNTPDALRKSLLVAEASGGRVIAFDSIEPSSRALPLSVTTWDGDPTVESAARARATQLRSELATLEQRVPVEALVGRGAPGQALLGWAARKETDLIVKATSAADVREMTVSGATALHLLRASRVPVWLYAPPSHPSGRVVALVNLSGHTPDRETLDEQVVLAAARLSALEGAELHVVCVANQARDRLYQCLLPQAEYRRYLAKDRDDLWRSLTDLVARLAPGSVPHLVEGNGLDALEKVVLELRADAVALGRDDTAARAGVVGLPGAERVFCRIDRSMLLVTPDAGYARARTNPSDAGRRIDRPKSRATVLSPAG